MKNAAIISAATPVIWSLLGYHVEAASILAGLVSCLVVRIYMGAVSGTRKGILVDVTTMALALMFTAGAIIMQRPNPFFSLLTGTGFGALGAGIIRAAVRYVGKLEAFAEAEPEVDDLEGIRRAMEQLKDLKEPKL